KNVSALITDMEQPLGRTVGNALEVKESIETLQGRGPKDLESLSLELAAWMLHLAGIAAGLDAARTRVRDALASGAGLRKFQEVIRLQGGDPGVGGDASTRRRACGARPFAWPARRRPPRRSCAWSSIASARWNACSRSSASSSSWASHTCSRRTAGRSGARPSSGA